MQTVIQTIPDWKNSGLFEILAGLDVPWKDDTAAEYLNALYMARSGNKYISPLFNLYTETDGTITSANLIKVVTAVYHRYKKNWAHLWTTLSYEYNPIENYSMTETKTYSDNGTSSSEGTSTDNMQTYGFNSSSEVNKDKDTNTSSSSGTSANSGNSSITRSGNVGVTTSQQMIESERELWKWNFFEEVFKDLDKELTLAIY